DPLRVDLELQPVLRAVVERRKDREPDAHRRRGEEDPERLREVVPAARQERDHDRSERRREHGERQRRFPPAGHPRATTKTRANTPSTSSAAYRWTEPDCRYL